MNARRILAALATASAITLTSAGCGEVAESASEPVSPPPATHPAKASQCGGRAPAGALSTLAIRLSGGRRIVRSAQVITYGGRFPKPMFEHGDGTLIAVDIRPSPGIAVWVVDDEMAVGGSGYAVWVNSAARNVSDTGAAMSLSKLGYAANTDDLVDDARRCLHASS